MALSNSEITIVAIPRRSIRFWDIVSSETVAQIILIVEACPLGWALGLVLGDWMSF